MAYCDIGDLQNFSGVFLDNDLQQSYIDSAFDIINNYLGYNALEKDYVDIVNGTGKNFIFLNAPNIKTVSKVEVDGKELDCTHYKTSHSMLYLGETIPLGIKNVVVEYTAGFDDKELPPIFKQVNVEIANLLQLLSDNNIGITSKSGADGSRTFIQNTNYDKYLNLLSTYRL